mmetsp:Transcript_29781/g.44028  ORF Transcript_29781/g.44028 Transcript_29781/m.44028 type:complete len:640 (+) Transcript_29781:81-2000(+)
MISRRYQRVIAVAVLSLLGLVLDFKLSDKSFRRYLSIGDYGKRYLSIDYGNGDCEWTAPVKVDLNEDPYGTLIASYPAAGMRLMWQMTAGAAGYEIGDDFFFNGRIGGLIKTEYPHPEGIWSYGKEMDQTILLIRNPRWNIPSYHTLLYELEYAHDYVVAYENVFTAFSTRAPVENWLKWRDYRFHDEVNMWGYFIDFWMENGPQFWNNLDYERAGQYPFRYNYETERPWPIDTHCLYDIAEGCTPKTVVSYERLRNADFGPEELRRIANVIRHKKGMDLVISDAAIDCIWLDSWESSPQKRNDDRDVNGTLASEYIFTVEQMEEILAKLIYYKHKYSTGEWEMNLNAREIVMNTHNYIVEISGELATMYTNPQPTMAPSTLPELVEWYNTLGRGNRHAKEVVQHMASYWGLVSDLYDTAPTPAPTACPEGGPQLNLTSTQQEWLDQHNAKRSEFFALKGLTDAPLKWSTELGESAQEYANKLATQPDGCWLIDRYQNDEYGTENLALDRGTTMATPTEVITSWHSELDMNTMTLQGERFHVTQLLFRSSKWVGCGSATKIDSATGEQCNFHVCRYIGPGNCFLEALIDVYPSFLDLLPPNCMDNHPDNYWICSVMSDHAATICQEAPLQPMQPSDPCT